MRSRQFGAASAGVGAGAVIAMGALGVAFSDVSAAEEPTPAPAISTPPSPFDQQPPD